MKTIIEFKEGIISNVVCLCFFVALALGGFGVSRRLGHGDDPFIWFICLAWLLFAYFPIANLAHPKSFALFIQEGNLLWRVRAKEGEPCEEEKIPLHTIAHLELVMPRVTAVSRPRHRSLAQVFLVTKHGQRHEIPLSLFPGVFWNRIVSALRANIPALHVIERVE